MAEEADGGEGALEAADDEGVADAYNLFGGEMLERPLVYMVGDLFFFARWAGDFAQGQTAFCQRFDFHVLPFRLAEIFI